MHTGADGVSEAPMMPGAAQLKSRPSVETEKIESFSLASIDVRDGRLIIAYDDAIDKDEPPVPTELSFRLDDPGLITLERHGFLRAVMIFEAGQRHRATYKTPLSNFEMTVFTRTAQNSLTPDGGTLSLEYAIEFRAAAEQKVKLTLEATRIA